MKSIQQIVENGIEDAAGLQEALKIAMKLEFSTIPPYLCAQWSIDSSNDPDDVADMIQSIVVQEMFHFALAGNMLTAIGGVPEIDAASFLPTYADHVLPGGIEQDLAVDLLPLSDDQLMVFMQIEKPEFPPVTMKAMEGALPATIGAFYTTLADGFKTVGPSVNPAAPAVKMGEAVQITSVADAIAAINRIKGEGEGTPGSPDQPSEDGKLLAHYYVFRGIRDRKAMDTGLQIRLPRVFQFAPSQTEPNPSKPFNQVLTELLKTLQDCWATGQKPSLQLMNDLQASGSKLIMQGVRPQFLWEGN